MKNEITELGPNAPTPPIALAPGATGSRLGARQAPVGDATIGRLRDACASVVTDSEALAEASRDWWPLAMSWALEGQTGGLASVVAKPTSVEEISGVLAVCNDAGVPLTAAAGRSGVCGGTVPVHGGVVLDLCGLSGIVDVDDKSLVVDVRAGTFGDYFEHELRDEYGVTAGHWPQSINLSTVGGWLACRGAGQLSTRYGKIEDMVVGLDVVLADGSTLSTGGNPRAAVGPDLNQLFVGSEGTLGIITAGRLRLHPAPPHERRCALGFPTFDDGLEACRRILRRGGRPAVLRLYDTVESKRNFDIEDVHVLLVLDEGDGAIVDTTMEMVAEECSGARHLDEALVDTWLGHRNDVSALERYISGGLVVDTMEITGRWGSLERIYHETIAAMSAVEGTLAVSAHQSHAYPDGACLYFTFGAKPPEGTSTDEYYRQVWDAGTKTVLANGGALSHHHGIGLNRARFVREALGPAFDVLVRMKNALDPNGILNPGKLGLPSPFGEPNYP
jgi:alkyldihydroxyacetonephosphate synthase